MRPSRQVSRPGAPFTSISLCETPFFSPRERAALAWTEALTRLSNQPDLNADYAALREQFSEREMVDLSLAISAINSWNRLAVGFGVQPPA